MTRKHFVLIAASIKQIQDVHARKAAYIAILDVGCQLSSSFNRDKFKEACGVA